MAIRTVIIYKLGIIYYIRTKHKENCLNRILIVAFASMYIYSKKSL